MIYYVYLYLRLEKVIPSLSLRFLKIKESKAMYKA